MGAEPEDEAHVGGATPGHEALVLFVVDDAGDPQD